MQIKSFSDFSHLKGFKMQIYDYCVDSISLIRKAKNAKSLGTLGQIENAANPLKQNPVKVLYSNELIRATQKEKDLVKGKTPYEILKLAGIGTKKLKDGTFALTEYRQPSCFTTFADLNVDEPPLITGVTKILKSLNLLNTKLKNTGKIATVQDDVVIGGKHALEDISSLKTIYGSVIVYANSRQEALELLAHLKFRPKKVYGKLIIIPEEVHKL